MRAPFRAVARSLLLGVIVATTSIGSVAAAQEPDACPPVQGIVCEGYVTDAAGVLADRDRVERAVAALVERYGHEVAIVIVDTSAPFDPQGLAIELGNTWGVGDPDRDDGVVVVVDLAARQTWVQLAEGIVDLPRDPAEIAAAGNAAFGQGDFDGGILAIVDALSAAFAEYAAVGPTPTGPTPTEPVGGTAPDAGVPSADPEPSTGAGWATVLLLGAIAAGVGIGVSTNRRNARRAERRRREAVVDDVLARLAVRGDELPDLASYRRPCPEGDPAMPTGRVVGVVRAVADGADVQDEEAAATACSLGLTELVDRERLDADTMVPLELRAEGEGPLLEQAVQQAAHDALAVPLDDRASFRTAVAELERLVASLRPHRVAAARRRVGEQVLDRLASTPIGWMATTERGDRLLAAAPILDPAERIDAAVRALDEALEEALEKTARLEHLYETLPPSAARPAVAAALADLGDPPEQAAARFELVRSELERRGRDLRDDGLDLAAVAALLLLNRDEDDVEAFVAAYRRNRRRLRLDPPEAVEFALAGLTDRTDVERVQTEARRRGLPVVIAAALVRRGDDGFAVYDELLDELARHGIEGDARRTIAGVLAVSLEPAQALRRWLAARRALAELGLTGSYADVAAAFGASDPRGPQAFALAYAAQREALARSTIDDADRFAPELAHRGTSRQEDTWTGRPIPRGLGSFDPFTFFYLHWIMTGGHGGSVGWEPIHRDLSWSGDRPSWFGGFGGGGGFAGGAGGGSSWSSGGGFGGFGGFGGGGGFSGGGGGGSGW